MEVATPPFPTARTFMFSVGEPSGDQNTAPIIQQLKKEMPHCICFGLGGPKMQSEGFVSLLPFEEFNKMGYGEVILHIPFFLKAKKILIEEMKKRQPHVLVCVDFSGFNTLLMKASFAIGIPVIWYIAPKFWAWKKKKHTNNLKKYATHIASIFPFEVDLLLPYTPAVSFVGNPLVEYIEDHAQNSHFLKMKGKIPELKTKETIDMALVPGSRIQEVTRILPVMIEACEMLHDQYPNLNVVVSKFDRIDADVYQHCIASSSVTFFHGTLEELFAKSDIALVTSGTATLQAALMCIPMVICYKTSWLTYAMGKLLVWKIAHIGLPNIIASKSIIPELVQHKMTPVSIVSHVQTYINSHHDFTKTVENLKALRTKLGSKKPSIELTALIQKVSSSAL